MLSAGTLETTGYFTVPERDDRYYRGDIGDMALLPAALRYQWVLIIINANRRGR